MTGISIDVVYVKALRRVFVETVLRSVAVEKIHGARGEIAPEMLQKSPRKS